MKIKIWTLLFATGLLSLTVRAQNSLTYTTNDSTITITGLVGTRSSVTNIVIPDTTNGYPVVSIGVDAFFNCTKLTDAVIPATVTNIADKAFVGCTALKNILFLGNAPALGVNVFQSVPTNAVIYTGTTNGWDSTFGGVSVSPLLIGLTNDALTIVGCNTNNANYSNSVTIPPAINSYPVVSLGDNAFANIGSLTSAVIPGSVTNIGSAAFYGCSSLTNVLIPQNLTSLGVQVFAYCSNLTGITLPYNITSLGQEAFAGCTALKNIIIVPGNAPALGLNVFQSVPTNAVIYTGTTNGWSSTFGGVNVSPLLIGLTNGAITIIGCNTNNANYSDSVTIPDSINGFPVTGIGDGVFAGISLANVTIPSSVTSLGDQAFQDDLNLTNVTFLGDAPALDGPNVFAGDNNARIYYYYPGTGWGLTFAGVPANELNIPFGYSLNNNSITITNYTGTNSAVTIPASINGYPVASIGVDAFYGKTGISSLVMPDTITSIASGSLYKTTVPDPLGYHFEYYYDGVFANCANLTNVVLSTNLTSISAGAFFNCSNLTSITIPVGVTYLGIEAFSGCASLTNVTFLGNAPDSGDANASFGDPLYVFNGDPATIYHYYPATGWGASYDGKPAVELSIPFTYVLTNGVATITHYTGTNSAITILDVVNGYPLGGIGANAFANSSLTSAVVSPAVASIGDSAFSGCSSLTNLMFIGNPPALGSGVFNNDNSLTVSYYSDAPGWGATYGGRPTMALIPYTYTTNNGTIAITGHLGTGVALTIPASIDDYPVANIADNAFAHNGLTSVTIPDSVTSLGNHAFDSCGNLTNVVLSANLASLGDGAFYSCMALANLTLPDTVTNIGKDAFYDSLLGESLTVPAGITSIPDNSFEGCGISTINIPDSVTNIGDYAFNGSLLTRVIIPGSVENIGSYVFQNCSILASVTMLNGVATINEGAFYNCQNLASVTMPDSVTYLGTAAFMGDALSSVSIPKGLTVINSSTFASTLITSLVIPTNITAIGAGAFASCPWLKEVVIPASVTNLADQAFYDCEDLTNVTFLGDAPGTLGFPFGNNGLVEGVPLTVYYYYGANGWGTNYPEFGWNLSIGGAVESELKWTPPVGDAGARGGNFGFNFVNTNGLPVVVEGSTNLVDWQPVWTNTLSGNATNFVDPQWTNYPNRFYRAR